MATGNFCPDARLGDGDSYKVYEEACLDDRVSSKVYVGWLDEKTLAPSKTEDGMAVAIKEYPKREQHFELWQSEVNFLGRHYHPNLIGLLGYCWEDEKLLLVFEYMPKGGGCVIEPLSWAIRLKIAIGAARGLTFLHNLEKKVIYRDFKTCDILLDEVRSLVVIYSWIFLNYNAKLSNFSLARLGPSSEEVPVSTVIAGTSGYIAPECFTTGKLYLKSDVYSFGVVLLELLMGLKVNDPEHPCGEQNLVDWLKSILSQERKLKNIMDTQIEGQYPSRAALQAAQLSLRCLELDPRSRPSMKEVVELLKEIEALASHLHEEVK
ncbi:hypothetical protein LWI28_018542 [Acer negundo]|uniref:Protein kinase domain-containing protein n=1 Tax=Acer negundo TaxID=4023 RepID=A0AAD5IIY4_ACENE|nr:hypothetical protein LWI28_018542 [Acer negundo]